MLHDDEIRVDTGRSSAGDFLRMIHLPSGIERFHPGSLKGVNRRELLDRWRAEIEVEVRQRHSQSDTD